MYARVAPEVDLSSATVFLLDEFDLPAGHAARCDSMLESDLLDSLIRAPQIIHRLNVDAVDADVECARFDALITDGGLNLTLLGLGGNGHLGLNESGTAADSPTRTVHLAPSTTEAAAKYHANARPADGLTLGMRQILGSGRDLASGDGVPEGLGAR